MQTLGGLWAASELGLETGGTAPLDWITETGMCPTLLKSFGLVECAVPGYPPRTLANARDSDITIIFSFTGEDSAGTSATVRYCKLKGKDFIIVDPRKDGADWECVRFITENSEKFPDTMVINIAGNRESMAKGIEHMVIATLIMAYRHLTDLGTVTA